MKFNEYKYERPNLENIKCEFEKAINVIKTSNSVEDVIKVIDEINKLKEDIDTAMSLCSIRYTVNTNDEFYVKEQEFIDENGPIISSYMNEYNKSLVECKFINELEEKYGKKLFDSIRLDLTTFSNEIIEDLQEENKLCSKYSRLIASAKIPFDGKVLNLSQFAPYTTNKDRNIRREAEKATSGFFQSKEEEFDELYDSLVKVRDRIARKLGFENFIPLAYARFGRTDYDQKMVANYRKQVYEDLVPVVCEMVKEQGKRLGIEDMKSYDLVLNFLSGNPKPKGNSKELVEKANKMYHEMSKETGVFFDFMKEKELLDLDAKEGKTSGGYCTYIPNYKSPFIFANFNGTSGDVDVLTHEAGHAFQVFSSRDIGVPEYLWPTMEACEIHSMSMEFFAWPWMELFFEEDKDKYLFSHLSGTITFIPYGVLVDEFQHEIYANPNMSKDERKALWRKIEKKYLPYKVYENEFLDKGTYWYKQGHIFESPFYYIDYTLAQVCAQQFWIKNQENHEKAWSDYYRLCCAGGSKTFLGLLEVANLKNPFIDGTVKYVVSHLKEWLDKVDKEKIK